MCYIGENIIRPPRFALLACVFFFFFFLLSKDTYFFVLRVLHVLPTYSCCCRFLRAQLSPWLLLLLSDSNQSQRESSSGLDVIYGLACFFFLAVAFTLF